MYYLKCSNCGYLNEVRTEYLVFCSACNKRISNNYSGWRIINPEKTYEEFLRLNCTTSAELEQSKVIPVKKTTFRWGYVTGIILILGLFFLIGKYGVAEIVKILRTEKTSTEVLDKKWLKDTYGEHGLIVETPAKLTKSDIPMPEQVKKYIRKMNAYGYLSARGFKILINTVEYVPEVGAVNLDGASNGSMNEAKMEKGVSDFTYTQDSIRKGDIPGFIQKGTFKQDGVPVEFINTGFAKGTVLWQVWVAYQSDDKVGKIASKRVIESIQIGNNH
jgi:hypothetical protein